MHQKNLLWAHLGHPACTRPHLCPGRWQPCRSISLRQRGLACECLGSARPGCSASSTLDPLQWSFCFSSRQSWAGKTRQKNWFKSDEISSLICFTNVLIATNHELSLARSCCDWPRLNSIFNEKCIRRTACLPWESLWRHSWWQCCNPLPPFCPPGVE